MLINTNLDRLQCFLVCMISNTHRGHKHLHSCVSIDDPDSHEPGRCTLIEFSSQKTELVSVPGCRAEHTVSI